MPDHGLRERIATEAKVLRDASWNGPAATMMDASSALSAMNHLLVEVLPYLHHHRDLAKKVSDALMNPDPRIVTPYNQPDHPVVGHFLKSDAEGVTYFCDSFSPQHGYWMTSASTVPALDGSDLQRKNLSEDELRRDFVLVDDPHSILRPWR
jgi:hypothetical protein